MYIFLLDEKEDYVLARSRPIIDVAPNVVPRTLWKWLHHPRLPRFANLGVKPDLGITRRFIIHEIINKYTCI